MALATFDSFMLPLLVASADGKEHSLSEIVETIADALKIPNADRAELMKSGKLRLPNRVSWAKLADSGNGTGALVQIQTS
jgi:restriction endonuclease Mrr